MSFVKKLITCVIAGLVIGETSFRFCITYLRAYAPIRLYSSIPFFAVAVAIVYSLIWQARKTNKPATLSFWQGLIRYGVAFDLAEFGWAKICHRQLVMPLYQLDLPYSSFTPSQLFWTFYGHSYVFGCILGALQIVGAMLLLFRRTTLVGVFVLLPILANILLMNIFYEIGGGVVFHTSIMLAGTLYFLFIEFDRLKEFFFVAKSSLPVVHFSRLAKMVLRLSIVYIPLVAIALHPGRDRNPQLTGKYEVKQLRVDQQDLHPVNCADSVLTLVYFDIGNRCVFEFNAQQRSWFGKYTKEDNRLEIKWDKPGNKPEFNGFLLPADSGRLLLRGTLGKDSIRVVLENNGR